MRLIAAVSILLAGAIAASAAFAQACVCSPDPFENRWAAADAVFVGTVKQIDELDNYTHKGNAKDLPVKVLLKIDQSFKGAPKPGSGFQLQTSLTKDTCTGHPFVKDKQYLVFAYLRRDDVYVSWSLYNMQAGSYDVGGLCGGTKSMENPATADDLALIKKKLADEPEDKPKGLMDKVFGN